MNYSNKHKIRHLLHFLITFVVIGSQIALPLGALVAALQPTPQMVQTAAAKAGLGDWLAQSAGDLAAWAQPLVGQPQPASAQSSTTASPFSAHTPTRFTTAYSYSATTKPIEQKFMYHAPHRICLILSIKQVSFGRVTRMPRAGMGLCLMAGHTVWTCTLAFKMLEYKEYISTKTKPSRAADVPGVAHRAAPAHCATGAAGRFSRTRGWGLGLTTLFIPTLPVNTLALSRIRCSTRVFGEI